MGVEKWKTVGILILLATANRAIGSLMVKAEVYKDSMDLWYNEQE